MRTIIAVLLLITIAGGVPVSAADFASQRQTSVRVQDRQPTHVIAYRNARQSGEQSDMEEEDTSAADDQQVEGRYGQNRPELIQFNNGSLRLYGALWKPAGRGPFPAVIYNHGSDPKDAMLCDKSCELCMGSGVNHFMSAASPDSENWILGPVC